MFIKLNEGRFRIKLILFKMFISKKFLKYLLVPQFIQLFYDKKKKYENTEYGKYLKIL